MEQTEAPLADAAGDFLADRSIASFTTPGHKRSPELAGGILAHDLPLSAGADDAHQSGDVLGRAERLAAALWGADRCRFCLNGSTQGNQALALAAARPGDRVVVSRNLHQSLFAGLVLAGLEPVWVRPDVDPETGLALALPAGRVEAALPGASAAFIVEPSFVGVVGDVDRVAASCRAAGVPLLVDQAWGAHFGFHPELPAHALARGADAFVASAHKTLTSFTQGAYLLARGGPLDLERLDAAFGMLETTSPSAAILASLDSTRRLIALRGEELLGRALALAAEVRERLGAVDGLRVVAGQDATKLVLALAGTGADGLAVEADLWREGIRVELANRDLLVPLLTIADTADDVERLVDGLVRALERRRGEPREPGAASAVWAVEAEVALPPREAFFAASETVAAADAPGRVAAETVAPYPPGIPAIAPGEVVTADLLEALREAAASGTRIASCADPTLETIRVVA